MGDLQASTLERTNEPEKLTVVCFFLGEKRYGANVDQICEAIRMVEITEIPDSPDVVAGVINLRGKVIPVIDLRKRLGMPGAAFVLSSTILIVGTGGKTVGVVVDGISDVLNIQRSSIDTPDAQTGQPLGVIEGVAKLPDGLLPILDFDKILNFEEKKQLEVFELSGVKE